MRITALDELHRALQRKGRLWSEQEMDVIGHEDKFVELKDSTVAICEKGLDEEPCCSIRTENRPSFLCHRGHKKCTICRVVHFHGGLKPLSPRLFSHGWKPCASTRLRAAIVSCSWLIKM
jgi:hypothetical protein